MTLYEIDKELEALVAESVDPETGELMIDTERFDALRMEREAKIENTVLLLKNVRADIAALKAEVEALDARMEKKKAFEQRLAELIRYATGGERFETARAAVTWRKAPERVVITKGCEEQFISWAQCGHDDLLRFKTPEINREAVKAALKAGQTVPFASLESGVSMTVR